MPFCPRCRTEYRPGFTRCADCGSGLVGSLPPDRRTRPRPVREVAIARFASLAEAEMWAGILRQAGIPSVAVPLLAGSGGQFSPTFSEHELRVRAEDAERAAEILGAEHS